MIPKKIFRVSGVLLIMVLTAWFFYYSITSKIGFVYLTKDDFAIQDYAYHIILTEQLLVNRQADIYAPAFQFKALSSYLNTPVSIAMPVGATPVSFFVWIPFGVLAHYNLSFSYTLWVVVSISVLILSLWKIFRQSSYPPFPPRARPIVPLVFIVLTILIVSGPVAALLGQTSILAAGLISLLLYYIHAGRDNGFDNNRMIITALVCLSALKPTYLLISVGILLIYQRKREFFAASAVLAVFLAAVTPFLTIHWVASYITNITMYFSGNFPDFYAWSVVPEAMNTFAGVWGDVLGRKNANGLSMILLIMCWIWIGCSACRRFRIRFHRLSLNQPQSVILLIAGCLLFSPHSGVYEDLLLIPVFVVIGLYKPGIRMGNWRVILLGGCLVASMFHFIPFPAVWSRFFLLFKAAVPGLAMSLVSDREDRLRFKDGVPACGPPRSIRPDGRETT